VGHAVVHDVHVGTRHRQRARTGNRQRRGRVRNHVVALHDLAGNGDGIGAGILALFTGELVIEHRGGIARHQARNRGGERRVGRAVFLDCGIGGDSHCRAVDGEGSRLVFHQVIALFHRTGRHDGIGAGVLAGRALDRVGHRRGAVAVLQPADGGGKCRIGVAVGLTGIEGDHGSCSRGDGVGRRLQAHRIVRRIGGKRRGDGVGSHVGAGCACQRVGNHGGGVAVGQAGDGGGKRQFGVAIDLRLRIGGDHEVRLLDGEGRRCEHHPVVALARIAHSRNGIAASVLARRTDELVGNLIIEEHAGNRGGERRVVLAVHLRGIAGGNRRRCRHDGIGAAFECDAVVALCGLAGGRYLVIARIGARDTRKLVGDDARIVAALQPGNRCGKGLRGAAVGLHLVVGSHHGQGRLDRELRRHEGHLVVVLRGIAGGHYLVAAGVFARRARQRVCQRVEAHEAVDGGMPRGIGIAVGLAGGLGGNRGLRLRDVEVAGYV